MRQILAIDDHEENLISLKAIVEEHFPDYSVKSAITGIDGFDNALKEPPSLIVLDVVMPMPDGYEVCRMLKNEESTRHIPIIMVTAHDTTIENKVKALSSGADAFISKPFNVAELVAQIQVALRLKIAEDRIRSEKERFEQLFNKRSEHLLRLNEQLSHEVDLRKKMQRRLSLREDRLQTIIRTVLDGYCVTNVYGEIIEVNHTLCRMVGYAENELKMMRFDELIVPDQRVLMNGLRQEVMQIGELRFELGMTRKNGDLLEVEVSKQFQPDDSGSMVVFVKDVTERNRAQSQLLEKENRYRTIFEVSPSGILLIDMNGIVVDVNTTFCSTLQYRRSELVGRPVSILIPDHQRVNIKPNIQRIAEGEILEHVVTNIRKDGTLCYMELKEALMELPDGNMGIISAANDITARMEAQFREKTQNEIAQRQRNAMARIVVDEGISKGEFNEAIARLCAIALETMQVYQISVWMFNESLTSLTCIARHSSESRPVEKPGILHRGDFPLYFEALTKNGQLFTHDACNDIRTQELVRDFLVPSSVVSLLDAGIFIEGSIAGVVCFEHKGNLRNWYVEEESFANTVASLIGQLLTTQNRRQAENKLVENEQRLRSLINSTPDYIVFKDGEGRWKEANDAALEYFALDAENYRGKTDMDLAEQTNALYHSSFLVCSDSDQAAWQNGKMVRGEEIIPSKDGSGRIFDVIKVPVLSDRGDKEGLVVLGRDITERKRAENLLKESEERFRQLFDKLGDAVFVTRLGGDEDGNILEANRAAIKQTGYTHEELLQMNIIRDIRYSDDSAGELDLWTRELLGGELINGVEQKVRKDGSLYWTEVVVTPLDYNGVSASLSINHDITARRRYELLQQLVYEVSAAVSQVADLKGFFDVVKTELGKVVDTTNFLIAYSSERYGKLNFPVYIDERIPNQVSNHNYLLSQHLIDKGQSLLLNATQIDELLDKNRVLSADIGVKLWMGVPLKVRGKVNGAIVVQSYADEKVFSEADLKLMEFVAEQVGFSIEKRLSEHEILAALKKAEEADQLKTAFLANMSHEIRTPMNGILGFAELLKLTDLSSDQRTEYLGIIEKSGRRMLNIINDIIDISKIEAGQMTLNKTATNLAEQVDYICTFFKPEAAKKGLSIIKSIDVDVKSAVVNTDKEKVFAILTNLVKNAIKYTHEGEIEVGLTLDGYCYQLMVRDTGIGIPQSHYEAIFNRFVQVDVADIHVYEGAGLGLSITKAYIELLNGRIRVESSQDLEFHGTTFFVTLPKEMIEGAMESNVLEPQNITEMTEEKKLKVIVAEDDMPSQKLIGVALKRIAKEFLYARNGMEVVELCRNNPDTDLILMDVKMPEMNGLDATREIRTFNHEVVIIAQTAFGMTGDKNRALEAGCNDYISKPLNIATFMALIAKYFQI